MSPPDAPAPPRAPIKPDSADLTKARWEPVQAQNASRLERVQMDNKPVLYIRSEQANCVGAWRASIMLAPGRYRFSGLAKSRGIAAQATRYGSGGGLRISGHNRQTQLAGDTDWTALREEFNVVADKPVRLFCELRANKGEIWFDLQSLKLERVE